MTKDVTTKLDKLNLVDKFLFDEVMEDTECYQAVISILLENEIELLGKPQTEKEFRVSPQLRQIRLDVVSMNREKKIFYTEMQQRNTGNLIKRSRYYQAQLDVSLLEPGSTDFNLLNDSFFILIVPFDLFGKGLYRYTFEGTCRECPELKLGDGAVRVFINTKGKNPEDFSKEFLDFMVYITASTDRNAENAESLRIKMIHENVRKVKKSEKTGVKYMQRWEEIAYAKQDGIEEGRIAGRTEGEILKLIKQVCKKRDKNKTVEEITEELEEEAEIIQMICESAGRYAPEYDFEKIYEDCSVRGCFLAKKDVQ